jgi:hypothetical protein
MVTRTPRLNRLRGLVRGKHASEAAATGRQLPADDYAITRERVRYLAEMTTNPTLYTQRFVEQLSFVPSGGQRWERSLQIEIPTSSSTEPSWWIVPLGPFGRSRFPDLRVTDADGAVVRLLTRKQHGVALTKSTLTKRFYEMPTLRSANAQTGYLALGDADPRAQYDALQAQLYDFYTEINALRFRIGKIGTILETYEDLLLQLNRAPDEVGKKLGELLDSLVETAGTTQYLCWIKASPGEVVHLQVTHTVRDPKHKLDDGSMVDLIRAIWIGVTGLVRCDRDNDDDRAGRGVLDLIRPAWGWGKRLCARFLGFEYKEPRRSRRVLRFDRVQRRAKQVNWYRQYGLAPINYGFNVPTHRYTASYYSTLVPPDNTIVSYLDWERGNSIGHWEQDDGINTEGEVSCAFPSVHIYNAPADATEPGAFTLGDARTTASGDGPDNSTEERGTIRAYIRCSPHHHKQILGAAALNIIVVWLLATGRLPDRLGDPLQGLILAAPSILIAYLIRQQRHYYANALRHMRAVLWTYLAIGVLFLVAIAFSERVDGAGSESLGWVATPAAWALAISSAAILAWYLPLGHSYERAVVFLAKRKWEVTIPPSEEGAIRAFVNDIRRARWRNRLLQRQWEDERVKTKWGCYEAAYELYGRLIWWLVLSAVAVAVAVLCCFWSTSSTERSVHHPSSAMLTRGPADQAPRVVAVSAT